MNESFPFSVWEVIVFRAEVASSDCRDDKSQPLPILNSCAGFLLCENKVQFKLFGARGLIPCS